MHQKTILAEAVALLRTEVLGSKTLVDQAWSEYSDTAPSRLISYTKAAAELYFSSPPSIRIPFVGVGEPLWPWKDDLRSAVETELYAQLQRLSRQGPLQVDLPFAFFPEFDLDQASFENRYKRGLLPPEIRYPLRPIGLRTLRSFA